MEQTFVLKLIKDLDVKTGSAQGHVEDVKAGKALRFHSVSELLIFLESTTKQNNNLEAIEDEQ